MVLKNLIKFLIVSTLSYNSLFAKVSDLSRLKQKDLELQKEINQKSATNLKYSWIKPIIASYSYSKSDQFGLENKSRYFRISLDQPIFKSGGIYFAIKYSDANREFQEIALKIKQNSLIKELYKSVFNLQKLDLEIKKTKLEIKNANIDIRRKNEQFQAGIIDSSFLDSALLKKSSLTNALLDLKSKKEALMLKFHTLSDKDYKMIKLPRFQEVSKEEFIQKNIELQQSKSKTKESRYLKDITISSYLPTISLFGEYSNKDDSYKIFRQQSKEYKNYGIRISMPIVDLNMLRKIEIDKLKYIQAKVALKDKQKEIEHSYRLFVEQLKLLKRREELAREDSIIYRRLIKKTKDGIKAGEKSKLDLQNLQNSQKIALLKREILQKEIELLYLDLFSKMSDEI